MAFRGFADSIVFSCGFAEIHVLECGFSVSAKSAEHGFAVFRPRFSVRHELSTRFQLLS